MASVTPGVLLKLLQSMNAEAKPASDHHRSAVLQVTSVLPTLSGPGDLRPSPHGPCLQLSDSSHSTLVSLPDPDGHPFLLLPYPLVGRLVLLDRLSFPSTHPLPLAHGLRPLRPSRPLPLVGSPVPLVARSHPPSFLIQTAPADNPPPFFPPEVPPPQPAAPPPRRRLPSPAASRRRSQSPAARPPSPARCEVPSLVAAKEEHEKDGGRRAGREPAIVVPSRYRQPSPRRGAAASPSRRLSGVMRASPIASGDKRKPSIVLAVSSSSSTSSAVRPVRKSWDGNTAVEPKEKEKVGAAKVIKPNMDSLLRTQEAISRRLSDASSKHSSTENILKNEKAGRKSDGPLCPDKKTRALAVGITVHDRKWTDGSIPLDAVPDSLSKLGKECMQRKNAAFAAACEAMEEACAAESLVRNLSMFCNLCATSKPRQPLPTIDRFLSIYADVLHAANVAEALATHRGSDFSAPSDQHKSIALWLEAALATDLQVVSLISSPSDLPVLENQPQPLPKRPGNASKTHVAKSPGRSWTRGSGVRENLDMARALCAEMDSWFLRFVEQALEAGFQLMGGSCEGGGGGVAAVLTQLKRVNEWLDAVGKRGEGAATAELVKKVKRKIYGFVITHVGSAFDSSVAISAS